MECWKDKCQNKVEFICPCSNPPIYSCDLHIVAHLKTISKSGRHPESLTILPNPITKKAVIDHLHKSLENLYEFRRKTISDLSMQIKLLNEKLKVTLNSFEEAIQKHWELISEINQLEIISKVDNNKVYDLLVLEPEESIEKLKDFLDIFSESEFLIDDKGKIAKKISKAESSQFIVFRNNTMKIVKTDLNNISVSTEFNISLDSVKSHYISMCLIPGNSIFCYGNYSTPSNTAFIIDSNNKINQLAPAPLALMISGSIYYKNYIYIFGGYTNTPVNNVLSYDLAKNKWENLNSMPAPSHFISCICKKNKILLSGFWHSKIYCYDIIQNSYSELHNVQVNLMKIVCGNKKNYYLIETGGNIYESNHEWKVWCTLGSSGIDNTDLIGFRALWQNKVYFALNNYNLYEFDLKEKKIQKIKTI